MFTSRPSAPRALVDILTLLECALGSFWKTPDSPESETEQRLFEEAAIEARKRGWEFSAEYLSRVVERFAPEIRDHAIRLIESKKDGLDGYYELVETWDVVANRINALTGISVKDLRRAIARIAQREPLDYSSEENDDLNHVGRRLSELDGSHTEAIWNYVLGHSRLLRSAWSNAPDDLLEAVSGLSSDLAEATTSESLAPKDAEHSVDKPASALVPPSAPLEPSANPPPQVVVNEPKAPEQAAAPTPSDPSDPEQTGAKPPTASRAQVAKDKRKGRNLNSTATKLLEKDSELMWLSAERWAKKLKCVRSTVHGLPFWITIMHMRREYRAQQIDQQGKVSGRVDRRLNGKRTLT